MSEDPNAARVKAYHEFLATLGVDRDTAEHRAAFNVAWKAGGEMAKYVASVTDRQARMSEDRNTIRGWE